MAKNKRLIILFGSKAKGVSGGRSDTDIAVLDVHSLGIREKMKIGEEMAERLNVSEDDLDVVDLWTASPLLQYEVAEHGKLIEGDEFDFLRFRVLAWKRYQDTAKFRRLREKVLAQKYAP